MLIVLFVQWLIVVDFSTAWDNRSGICGVVRPLSILYATHMTVNWIKECVMALASSIMPTVHDMRATGSAMWKVEKCVFSSVCHSTNVACWVKIECITRHGRTSHSSWGHDPHFLRQRGRGHNLGIINVLIAVFILSINDMCIVICL